MSRSHWLGLPHLSTGWFIAIGIIVWLVFISMLHSAVNGEHSERTVITMGYMPVITNLAAPILDQASKEGDGVRYKAVKYASFADMAESLRNGQLDVAFMIAPLSIVLRQQGEDVKIVYIGNRHESTLVARTDLNIKSVEDLEGRTVAVPMRFSGHNLSILDLIKTKGLEGRVKVVEMNPPDMASALAAGALDAYYVGEPFASRTLMSGDSSKVFDVEDVWKNFICNLAVVRNDFIKEKPEIVKRLVAGAARSGIWADNNPKEAAQLASKYWNQPVDLVEYALDAKNKRIVYDQYVPKNDEMQYMADLMVKFDLAKTNDISGLVDDSFAKAADISGVTSLSSILSGP